MASKTEDKTEEIVQHYLSEIITTKDLAEVYNVTPRTIQRIIKKFGITADTKHRMKIAWQTSEVLKEHAKLCKANAKSDKRKWLNPKLRLHILEKNNFMCQFCGSGKEARLHIDHIDKNPSNNDKDNLRVLCMQCNLGRNTFMEEIYGK